jgi:opacity protein-like surface antigen
MTHGAHIARSRARAAFAAAALLTTGLSARPAAADEQGMYVGADVGYTLSTYGRQDINSAVASSFASGGETLALSSSYARDRQTPASADVGYRFLTYFGVEASYLTLGTVEYASRGKATSLFGGGPTEVELSFKSRGPALALTGALPMTNDWSLTVRLGAYEGKTLTHYASDVDGTAHHGSVAKTSTSLLAGVGSQYVIAAHWVLRLDYTHLNQLGEGLLSKSFNVDLLSAGVNYVF